MKYLKIFLAIAFAFSVLYLIGPRAHFAPIDWKTVPVKAELTSLDSLIKEQESRVSELKPDNEARIVWSHDSLKQKTPYVLLYLHGFSASQEEGDPLHLDFARYFGMNLYLPRLEGHGRADVNSFQELSPDSYFESAQQALEVAKLLGDSIIIMSCSTGGTLAILLEKTCPEIAGCIFYSPNIDLFDPVSDLIVQPWGKQILRYTMDGDYNYVSYDSVARKYWNPQYHINGIVALKSLLHDYMTDETFRNFDSPFFLAYYYKDEEHQDQVVSVHDMLDFYKHAGTRASKKRKYASATAETHVISSGLFSKDLDRIKEESFKFATEVMGLKPNIKHD